MQASERQLNEFHLLISKMDISACCVLVLPELGIRWRNVSSAIRNARLPMAPASVARVLRRLVARSLPAEALNEIIIRLRLKLVATEKRTWHLIKLVNPVSAEPADLRAFPSKVLEALVKMKRGKPLRPEVENVNIGDFIFLSVQLTSSKIAAHPLYVAVLPAPTPDVMFASSTGARTLLKACAIGLGYESWEDACLSGPDMPSLLRIYNRSTNEDNIECLDGMPEYAPVPVRTSYGIDYTCSSYNEQYVDAVLGPNPPLLTKLEIETVKPFYDPSRLNKSMKMKVDLKSDDIARTLKTLVKENAIAPNSDFFHIFHQTTSNKIMYTPDD